MTTVEDLLNLLNDYEKTCELWIADRIDGNLEISKNIKVFHVDIDDNRVVVISKGDKRQIITRKEKT